MANRAIAHYSLLQYADAEAIFEVGQAIQAITYVHSFIGWLVG